MLQTSQTLDQTGGEKQAPGKNRQHQAIHHDRIKPQGNDVVSPDSKTAIKQTGDPQKPEPTLVKRAESQLYNQYYNQRGRNRPGLIMPNPEIDGKGIEQG